MLRANATPSSAVRGWTIAAPDWAAMPVAGSSSRTESASAGELYRWTDAGCSIEFPCRWCHVQPHRSL
jgi:hypothetical protein